MKKLTILIFSSLILVGCNANKIANIEDSNNYMWQNYMNEEEFQQLQKGDSYMQVVEIAGGEGELVEEDENRQLYVWNDELLMTQGYELIFINNKLESMEIVERKGVSDRVIEEKEPAVPGSY